MFTHLYYSKTSKKLLNILMINYIYRIDRYNYFLLNLVSLNKYSYIIYLSIILIYT